MIGKMYLSPFDNKITFLILQAKVVSEGDVCHYQCHVPRVRSHKAVLSPRSWSWNPFYHPQPPGTTRYIVIVTAGGILIIARFRTNHKYRQIPRVWAQDHILHGVFDRLIKYSDLILSAFRCKKCSRVLQFEIDVHRFSHYLLFAYRF